jgi:hypothetical protein
MEREECSPELLSSLKTAMETESQRKGFRREVVKAEILVQKVTAGVGCGAGTSNQRTGSTQAGEPGCKLCI